MKHVLVLLVLSLGVAEAQVNQIDSAGKKNGKWIVYLDKNWKSITDSSKAIYHRYTYYDHGVNVYPMGKCGGKNFKLETVSTGSLLNGEYKWYDNREHLSSIHVFKDGEYVLCNEYYSSGTISQRFDYTKKCEEQSLGWTVYVYDKKGNLILASPTCKDKNGRWPKMR